MKKIFIRTGIILLFSLILPLTFGIAFLLLNESTFIEVFTITYIVEFICGLILGGSFVVIELANSYW